MNDLSLSPRPVFRSVEQHAYLYLSSGGVEVEELAAGGQVWAIILGPKQSKQVAGLQECSAAQQLALASSSSERPAMGLLSSETKRCGCRCECVTTSNLHGDVVRRRSRSHSRQSNNSNDGPDAVLEGLAMAGLVAILRQLGDLAELAAEVFDELQEQVVAASARGRGLAVRAKRLLELQAADLDLHQQLPPPSTTQNSAARAATVNITTHAALEVVGVGGMMPPKTLPPPPRLVDHRIKRCRGPPRLSLLDKFDAAGEGACLKRYTDPSSFRAHYSHSHSSAKLEQGSWRLRGRANGRPYLLKPMSMETSKSKFQTRLNSEPPEPAHTVTDTADCESETETETSEAPSSPGFLSMLRQLKQQHRWQAEAAGAASLFRIRMHQQTAAVHRVEASSPQKLGLGMEKKKLQLQLQGGTAQPSTSTSTSTSTSELERTSSFEAWLSPSPPDAHARRFPIPTTAATTHHHEHHEIITQETEPEPKPEPEPESEPEPEPEPPHPHPHPHPHGATATATATTCTSASISDVVTTSVAALSSSSSSTMLKKAKLLQNYSADAGIKSSSTTSWRYKGSVEMIASRVSSLPRKLFMNLVKHHHDCPRSDRAGTSSLQATTAAADISGGDCSPELELEAVPTPRAPQASFLPIQLHSDEPVIHNLIVPQNDKCHSVDVDAERHHHHQKEDPSPPDQCSNSNGSSPETEACGDPPDSNNLLWPGILVLKRPGANLPPENPSSGDTKVDTTTPPPLPPIPPVQWLSEKVYTGTRAASPKQRVIWKKSQEVRRADKSNDALHSVRTQVAETIHIQATSIHTSPVTVDTEEETLVSDENTSANVSHRDEVKCSEETIHPPQQFRVLEDVVQASSEGIVPKAGELPVPAILSDEAWSEIDLRTQAQAVNTCFHQQDRLQFGSSSSGHSDEKRSEKHEASHSSSNLLNESVFFSAAQELAKMSPPPSPSVRSPKHPLALRNGPSLIHPSRNILDSRRVLIEQIKDIAMAGNPSFKLKPVSGASSPVAGTGSPTNSKVATILQRADDIRQADTNNNDVDSEVSWSDDSE